MPSAPRLVGRPSVPRALAMPIWGLLASSARGFRPRRPVFAQDAGGFRFRLVPDLRLRKIFRLVNDFAIHAVPTSAQRGFAFGVFPRRQDLRSALLSPISLHPSKTVHQTNNFTEKADERPNRHRPTPSLLRATSSRKATTVRARRAQNGRAIRIQRREAGLQLDKRRRATKRPFAAEPLSAPRLRPRPPKRPARLLETRWAEGTVASARPTFC